MGVKLTDGQMTTVKSMVEVAEHLADQILYIMQNSELHKVDGCQLQITVSPEFKFVTEQVTFGYRNTDAGFVRLAKGVHDATFKPTGDCNSPEYEILFADEKVRNRMVEILHREKPLPPDGLWICDDRFDSPVDSGV